MEAAEQFNIATFLSVFLSPLITARFIKQIYISDGFFFSCFSQLVSIHLGNAPPEPVQFLKRKRMMEVMWETQSPMQLNRMWKVRETVSRVSAHQPSWEEECNEGVEVLQVFRTVSAFQPSFENEQNEELGVLETVPVVSATQPSWGEEHNEEVEVLETVRTVSTLQPSF